MKAPGPVGMVILPAADQDISNAIHYYRNSASADVRFNWVKALEATLRAIAEFPNAGSLRYADLLALPGLRYRIIEGFPWLIFYRIHAGEVEVIRVLHGNRDIPQWLQQL